MPSPRPPRWPTAAAALALGLSLPGCLHDAGRSLGSGLMQAINENAETAGHNVIKGAAYGVREDVLSDPTAAKLDATMSQVFGNAAGVAVNKAGEAAIQQLPAVREQVLGQLTREQAKLLVETLLTVMEQRARRTGQGLMTDVGDGLRQQVLNDATQAQLNALLAELLVTTRGQTKAMRDDLLGQDTHAQVKLLVDGAMGSVVDGTDQIRRHVHEELSFVQRNTAETLLLFGGLAGFALGFVWRQKEKNRLLLNLLARHLHDASADQGGLSEKLGKLETQAKLIGVHRQLQDALANQGMVVARPGEAAEAEPKRRAG